MNNCNCNGNNSYGFQVITGATDVRITGGSAQSNTLGAISGANVVRRTTLLVGYNPLMGSVTTPAVPATGVSVTNDTGVDVTVYVSGGTVSAILIDGSTVSTTSNISLVIPSRRTIQINYTVAPTWKWIGN